jgi:hypothetical protein
MSALRHGPILRDVSDILVISRAESLDKINVSRIVEMLDRFPDACSLPDKPTGGEKVETSPANYSGVA